MNPSSPIWRRPPSDYSVQRATPPLGGECGSPGPVACPRTGCGAGTADRLLGYFRGLSRCAALPLAIWLSSGWIGLLNHCHACEGFTFLFEKAAQTQSALLGLLAWEWPRGTLLASIRGSVDRLPFSRTAQDIDLTGPQSMPTRKELRLTR